MNEGVWKWNQAEILRYLGCKGQPVPENVEFLIEECKRELEQCAAPRAVWREFPLELEGDEIRIGAITARSCSLGRNLKDCTGALLFAATLGSQVDIMLHRYGKLQMSKAVVFQAVSVAFLEEFCDEKNRELKEEYQKQGRYLRPRFSPGYGDFSLECQRQLVPALDLGRRIGVTLTDSLLMAPSKSITAVIGISDIPVSCRIQGCEICQKKDCAYRR